MEHKKIYYFIRLIYFKRFFFFLNLQISVTKVKSTRTNIWKINDL